MSKILPLRVALLKFRNTTALSTRPQDYLYRSHGSPAVRTILKNSCAMNFLQRITSALQANQSGGILGSALHTCFNKARFLTRTLIQPLPAFPAVCVSATNLNLKPLF